MTRVKTSRIVNSVLGKLNNKTNIITKLSIDGVDQINPLCIANNFNTYFANIGSSLSKSIVDSSMNPLLSLKKIPRSIHRMEIKPTTPRIIEKYIEKLEPKTGSGYNN